MKFLRQSTAATVVVGPFVDVTDGFTAEAGLTDQSANGRLIKNGTGGAITVSSWAHDWNGQYLVGLSTAHTDTVGRLRLAFYDVATYRPVVEDFMVLPANSYDSIVAGSDVLQTDLTQIDGLATSGNNATLNLKQLNVQNSAGDAVYVSATSGHGIYSYAGTAGYSGMYLRGNTASGTSCGLRCDAIYGMYSTGNYAGLHCKASSSSYSGIYAEGGSGGAGIKAIANQGTNGYGMGMYLVGRSYSANRHPGLLVESGDNAAGIKASGGVTSGSGMEILAGGGNSDGLKCVGSGTGGDINADITGNLSGSVGGSSTGKWT